MLELWQEYNELADELEKVKSIIQNKLIIKTKSIEEVIQHAVKAEGKYIRAGLTILAAKSGQVKDDNYLNLAAAIELIHLATLIHDDIIDEASLRRGQASVQSRFGKNIAVYTGDFIFTKCFSLLAVNHQKYLDQISDAMERICMGEIIQYNNRYNTQMTFKQYIKIISGKTAVLFALALSSGATEGGFEESAAKRFAKIGYYIGMCFQIIDDCLDYTSNQEAFKKNTNNDLKQGLFTLPLIYALDKDKEGTLKKLVDETDFNEEDIQIIINKVHELDGVENSIVLARKYAKKAHKELSALKLDGQSRTYLARLIDQLLERTY